MTEAIKSQPPLLFYKGKTRRTRDGVGRRKDTKRAIVTLREGTIDIYG